MNKPLHIVILAAGHGSRMKSATPKVLIPLAGAPLLSHCLRTARAMKPQQIHVVIGFEADRVRDAFANADDINWVHQEPQNGTGHAVSMVVPHIPSEATVLVLFGDSPLLQATALTTLIEQCEGAVGVMSAQVADPSGYGRIVRDGNGHFQSIVEHRDATAAQRAIAEVNGGTMVLPGEHLPGWLSQLNAGNDQGELYLTDVIELSRRDGIPVRAIPVADPDDILGANDRWQLSHLERLFQRRQVEALCKSGATVMDPGRVDIRGRVVLQGEASIDVGVVIIGDVVLGDGVSIGPYCVITDCELGPGTRVAAHSVLEGTRTEGNCDIGPFARLRPGTELGVETRVGNFVETKKARVGRGSKINHLSYVGDARLGERVNIGAGTITCNYDGANKHLTEIEDDAFIGSDTQLVAPVKVGAGATIGAGSTISNDAPPGQLTLSRARQKSIAEWSRPTKKSDPSS